MINGERRIIGSKWPPGSSCDGHTRRVPYQIPERVGTASSLIHHGEILQGVFYDDKGTLRRGLISMPCDLYSAQAAYTPMPTPSIVVEPPSGIKAAKAARETLAVLGWPSSGGYLELIGNVPTSRGFGSSTSDVLAAIWAVQDAFGCELPETVIARIAVQAETASDSLMFSGRVVLFAQRDGEIIEDFGSRLPRLSIVGFTTSKTGCGIDTLALRPAEYQPWEVDRFCELRDMLRAAFVAGDVQQLGAVATASTVINQRHLPMGPFDLVMPLIQRAGAVGLQTAHSGDIAGLLFDGTQPDIAAQQDYACSLLRDIGITDIWCFTAGG